MKNIFLSLAICILFALHPSIGEGADKKQSVKPVGSNKNISSNSLGAPSLDQVVSELLQAESKLKDDPFDPDFKKKALKEIFSKYIGKNIFIPIGVDSTGDQRLGGLGNGYDVKSSEFFISLSDIDRFQYFGHVTSKRMCGSSSKAMFRGTSIDFNQTKLSSCSSDIGEITRCNVNYDMAVIKLSISNEVARSLSGNVERFVVFDNINLVFRGSNHDWGPNDTCHDIDNTASIQSKALTFTYRDKVSGRNVLVFRIQ